MRTSGNSRNGPCKRWLSFAHLCAGPKHQRLKHAAACRSTCFWGLLVGVLKHDAACRRRLKIGLGLSGEKDQIRISIPPLCSLLPALPACNQRVRVGFTEMMVTIEFFNPL